MDPCTQKVMDSAADGAMDRAAGRPGRLGGTKRLEAAERL